MGIPLSGLFELTPLCNLDCKMCYVHLNSDQLQGAKLLSTEQWKSIMAQAHSLGMMKATLSGGECLTYPGFDELFIFLRSLGIRPSIKTNGLLLDKKRIEFFNNNKPKSLMVSLYGSSNEAYLNVTGHAVFDTIYENMQQLKKAEFPVNLVITPSRYLYEDIQNLLNLAEQLHFPYSVNMVLFPPREETARILHQVCQSKCSFGVRHSKWRVRTKSWTG